MERLWLRAAIAVLGGLLLAVPLLVAREFGWHLNGGRKLEDPSTRAQVTVVVLDARDADWAASRPSGWQSAALEGVRLSIVDRAHPLNLQP